jgi:hypothetical protein
MYEQKYPEVEDLVMVKVKQIADMGAYVSLLEYNNIEGKITFSQLEMFQSDLICLMLIFLVRICVNELPAK